MKELLLIGICRGVGTQIYSARENGYTIALSTGFYIALTCQHEINKPLLVTDWIERSYSLMGF